MKNLMREIRIGLISTLMLALIVCGIYPMLVWGIAQGLFHDQANGSLIIHDHKIIGSSLISQGFTGARYFHPRPSAAGMGFDPMSSGGSNLGPLSKVLADTILHRVNEYRIENNLQAHIPVPADAVTASASGLDPHISILNALLQSPRVAKARGLSEEVILEKIVAQTEDRDLGIFGEPRVNVLVLNLDLDRNE
jgi:K+-transporting ATPase ATPase C chain